MKLSWLLLVGPLLILLGGSSARAESASGSGAAKNQDTAADKKRTKSAAKPADDAPPADNTGVNKRDRDERVPTADQQKNAEPDLELAAEIRRSVVKDESLSTNAQNVKIIVEDGNVTLRGPVASRSERANIEKKAHAIVGKRKGKGRVINELDVAP